MLGQAQHGYLEAVVNHDAVALGVAERVAPGLSERIMRALLGPAGPPNPATGVSGLRPFSLVVTNAGGLDDMENSDADWLWSFGTWVNGGEWATCEARMMLAYAATGRSAFSLDSMRALMGFANIFRMDSPLVKWGSEVCACSAAKPVWRPRPQPPPHTHTAVTRALPHHHHHHHHHVCRPTRRAHQHRV